MYARQVAGREVNLAVSGMLWEMSLVIVDQETNSLWSHILGEAMRGPLTGNKLTVIPSVMTDWNSWKTSYPETSVVVLSRTTDTYTRNMQLQADDVLIGFVRADQSRAWRLRDLRKQPVANDQLGEDGVLVVYDVATGTAVIHSRSASEQSLTFAFVNGRLVDQQTGSVWDLLTGVALTPPLKGVQLQSVEGIIANEYAWSVFHPESSYWKPGDD